MGLEFSVGLLIAHQESSGISIETRDKMVVRLNRRRGGEEGIYRCEIPDSTNVIHTIYIGVYTANTGE